MGRIFFNGAQTICCLKLAIAFDAQSFPDRVSHRSSMGIELPRSNCVRKAAYLDFVFYVTTVYAANYLPIVIVI
jgi:hypothetical protein